MTQIALQHPSNVERRRFAYSIALLLASAVALVTVLVFAPHQRSINFWSPLAWFDGSYLEYYDSVEGMSSSADVVILGQIRSVRNGRSFGTPGDVVRYGTATLEVGDILANNARIEIDDTVNVEVMLPHEGTLERLNATVPSSVGIYFLRNKGLEAAGQNASSSEQAEEAEYFRLVNGHGVLEEVDGSVTAPMAQHNHDAQSHAHDKGRPHDHGPLLNAIAGKDLGEVAAIVREVTQ